MARIERSIEINVPIEIAFQSLTQFENFPRFMQGVRSVYALDDAHLHWCAEQGGHEREWDVEIIRRVPNHCLSWRNTSGPKSEGTVTVEQVQPDKTRVTFVMEDEVAHARAQTGAIALPPVDEDLARFKKMLETDPQEQAKWRITPDPVTDNMPPAASSVSNSMEAGISSAKNENSGTDPDLGGIDIIAADGLDEAGPQAGYQATSDSDNNNRTDTSQAGRGVMPDFLRPWFDSLSGIRKMRAEMDKAMEKWVLRSGAWPMPKMPSGAARGWLPVIEIMESSQTLKILAELPGVKKDQIRIEIAGENLIITGQRDEHQTRGEMVVRHSESHYGKFYRALPLPGRIDPDSIRASFHDGVLEVRMPMPVQSNKQIPIE